ncbi:nucleotide disphospho-sugar-binding domain-containing protein [Cryobacterium sp. M15]|uniref:nucleotide disphospho-sugar-binding domain-containing protein n=1 Tax=Cryobacterium sp. M15 TaxID=2048291 RepID=UPI000CE50133|nr:nucleotide disphospho-sugar-binding domain-containing protein [Cryobacterium sp. M15]
MTLLIISPDYASHLYPLATLGVAWAQAGERVVVASGPATADIVTEFGFEREHLQLGRGSNPGTIRAEQQPAGEDDALRGFFNATRRGMVDTLRFQAEARSSDLLYNPVVIAREVQRIVARVQPDQVIVDHLAFSARLGLLSAGVAHADVVLGHPSALPVAAEVYGYPPAWPAVFSPAASELALLHGQCAAVRDTFTAQWNNALRELDPHAEPSRDAFQESGDVLLLNYPGELHAPARTRQLPPHVFLGSAVRSESVDPEVEAWLAADSLPVVYVSFGSFLSVRGDVLTRVVAALDGLPVRVAIAAGATDPTELGALPAAWLVRAFLPQVRLLQQAVLAVTHGGNNSVTEAMTAGVPLVVLPFSTDQFAGAAALDDAGFGISLPPNTATVLELRAACERMLRLSADSSADPSGAPRARLDALALSLTRQSGAERAYAALTRVPARS